MGIHGLAKVIGDYAAHAIKENEIKSYFGRKIAVDASMCIYQFLIAVRQEGGNSLTNEEGETTSHLMGMFYRTIRLLENGIKPVYVFDGKPPELKGGELAKRQERRAEAQENLEKATETGDAENVDKFTRRLVKVTKEHGEECRKLLKLMGVPYVEAPCEAEAQCCALVKTGKVYAVGTEDMDALTFGGDVLVRHLTFSEAKKMPIKEFTLRKVLEGLEMSHEQFIDLCILLGCDYCDTIKGIGPKRAVDLVKEYKSIDVILEKIDKEKYKVPENWLYKEARQLFIKPEITDPDTIDLKWTDPDEEGIVQYMCNEKGFNEERMRNGVKKILKARNTGTQVRLDSFFKVTSTTPKRKTDDTKENEKKKAKKGGNFKAKVK
jgi:flap endonuclease-1